MELNSCHCSDSSRAERRGSERSDEQVSGARRAGERGREARPGEAARPGAGAGEGVQSGAGAAARAAGPRPSQRRLSWSPAGPPDAGSLLSASVRAAPKLRRRVDHRKFILSSFSKRRK